MSVPPGPFNCSASAITCRSSTKWNRFGDRFQFVFQLRGQPPDGDDKQKEDLIAAAILANFGMGYL